MPEVDPVRLPPRLAARFRLDDVLGRGAGSVVHRAHDDLLDRGAVVKIVSVTPGSAPALGRFAALDHPHLVPVFDVELDEQADGGPRAVIVTDPSGGGDLRSRIVRGPLDLVDALVSTAAIADALDHAHRAGVAHLAIAPRNVLFDEDGRARLADTGLATVTARSSEGFLAPEQRRDDADGGAAAGAPADVHALGLVLVASLTGGPDGPGSARPEPLPDTVPDAVHALVDRMLAEDPAARPLASEVTVVLRRAALAVEPAAAVVAPAPVPGPRRPSATPVPVPRGLLLVAAAAVMALLAGTVVLASTGPVEEIASDMPPAVSAAPAQGVLVPSGPGTAVPGVPGDAGEGASSSADGDDADDADDADAVSEPSAEPPDTGSSSSTPLPTGRPTASPVAGTATPTGTSPTGTSPTGTSPSGTPATGSPATGTTSASPAPGAPTDGGPTPAPDPSEPGGTESPDSPGLVGQLLNVAGSVL